MGELDSERIEDALKPDDSWMSTAQIEERWGISRQTLARRHDEFAPTEIMKRRGNGGNRYLESAAKRIFSPSRPANHIRPNEMDDPLILEHAFVKAELDDKTRRLDEKTKELFEAENRALRQEIAELKAERARLRLAVQALTTANV